MANGIFEFRIENVAQLDSGRIAEAFNMALAQVLEDCTDRPAFSKPRKVTLEVIVKPTNNDGEVSTSFNIGSKIPGKSSNAVIMQMRRAGASNRRCAVFSAVANDQPDQQSLFNEDSNNE